MAKIFIYDTTLRDGSQGEGISLSVEDKLKIAAKLDYLGVDYIEGGWPGSNPKDLEFYRRLKGLGLQHARVSAFGSTRRPGSRAEEDANLAALLETGMPVVTLVGKSWDFHVTVALGTTLAENLAMIRESVGFLAGRGLEVIFDAEHFFDGYKHHPDYALAALRAAQEAGARWLVLCDTNGGALPQEIAAIVGEVKRQVPAELGIHAHNDGELAVANTLAAVGAGAQQVQGTMNGFGERCGNANLCSVLPNLELKLGYRCLPEGHLQLLTEVSRYIAEVANVGQWSGQPFVGSAAFTHKGGLHVSAVLKDNGTYEHIRPEDVGNARRVLVSEQAGLSNLAYKMQQMGLPAVGPEEARRLVQQIKEMEFQGYQFEGAEGSLELLLRRALGTYQEVFQLASLKIIVEKKSDQEVVSEAILKIRVGDEVVHTAAEGDGPVNALDNALRKALEGFFPGLRDMHLSDYKVRVLNGNRGTAAKVRVLIDSQDATSRWSTVGVSENIIEASWQALVDSMNYYLLKIKQRAGCNRSAAKDAETPPSD